MRDQLLFAMRRLRSTPGFSIIVLVSLAFGVGLNILIFSFTSPVLVKALPYPDSDRLLDVSMAPPDRPEARGPLTPALYALLRDKTSAAFEAIGVYDAGRPANLSGDSGGLAERLSVHRISVTGLAALGVTPLHGRLPLAADEQASATPTVMLSYPLWQERFGGRADIVNQTVNVDGQATQILGVMPQGFGLLDNFSDAWFTSGFEAAPGQETQKTLRGIGRLKPGASMADAQAAVKLALDEYGQMFPTRDQGWTVELRPWRDARLGGMFQPLLYAQLAVGVILLFLCVSLAVVLHARTVAGERSGVLAPVQTRAGVVVAESLLLSLGGTAIGAVFVVLGLPALLDLTPGVLPRLDEVTVDATTLAFAGVLWIVAGLVIGIVPAWLSSRRDTRAAAGSGGSAWIGRLGAAALVMLLAVQMTLAFVLLAGTGLATKAVGDLQGRDIGIDPSGLLSVDVFLPRSPYVVPSVAKAGSIDLSEYPSAGPAVFDRVRTALQSLPGVVQAAGVATQPFSNAPFVQFFIDDLEHTPDNQVSAQYLAVTENYFNTMGIRLVRGRDFSAADQPDSPWVVLVNETLAKQQWPDGEALGHRLSLTFYPDDGEPAREIVGVVADTLPFRGASEVPPFVYLLHRQQAALQRTSVEGRRTVMSFIARTSGEPLALGDDVRALVAKVDMTTPVAAIRTVESYANAGQIPLLQYAATLLGVMAVVVVVVAAAGTYGLTSYGVMQGRRGLALLLPASAAVAIGVVVGRTIWLRLGSVIESFLTNLSFTPSDPTTIAVAGGVLVAAACVAFLAAALGTPKAGR